MVNGELLQTVQLEESAVDGNIAHEMEGFARVPAHSSRNGTLHPCNSTIIIIIIIIIHKEFSPYDRNNMISLVR